MGVGVGVRARARVRVRVRVSGQWLGSVVRVRVRVGAAQPLLEQVKPVVAIDVGERPDGQ